MSGIHAATTEIPPRRYAPWPLTISLRRNPSNRSERNVRMVGALRTGSRHFGLLEPPQLATAGARCGFELDAGNGAGAEGHPATTDQLRGQRTHARLVPDQCGDVGRQVS